MIMYVKNDYSGMYDLHLTQIIFICVKKKNRVHISVFLQIFFTPPPPPPPSPNSRDAVDFIRIVTTMVNQIEMFIYFGIYLVEEIDGILSEKYNLLFYKSVFDRG